MFSDVYFQNIVRKYRPDESYIRQPCSFL